MRIKFLATTPSDSPSFPFQAGQVIDVPKITRAIRQWLADGAAFVLSDPPMESAVARDVERAIRQ